MKRWNLLLSLVLLGGCAASPDTPPEWLDGRSDKYPEARYLAGQGQAESAAVARDRARADLVKIFEARIAEESRDTATATRESSGGKVQQSSESRAERSVSVTSGHTVQGITIAEVWQDPKARSYHALAVLDRLRAGEALRGEIQRLDNATERDIQLAKQADDLLAQIAAAFRATGAQRERAALQRDLRVVDVTGVGVPARWEVERLAGDLNQLAKRLRLSAAAGEDPVGNLRTMLAGAISRSGFTQSAAEQADYHLTAALDLDQSQSGGWYWAKGLLSLTLTDGQGNVRGQHQWPVKASAQQATVARQRVMGEVDRVLRTQLREAVLGIAAK